MSLSQEQVDHTNLAKGNRRNGGPGQPFAEAQSALNRLAESELYLGGANFNGVAIAKESLLNRLAVYARSRVRMASEEKTFGRPEIELEVLIPNPVFLQLQIKSAGTTDAYRKTAGHPYGTRLFAGQNLKLDHH